MSSVFGFRAVCLLLLTLACLSGAAPSPLAPREAAAVDCTSCDDGNPCTDDICDPQLGCLHASNSAPCSDGNACTTNDVCNGGTCVGGNPAAGCAACQAVADLPASGGTFVGTTSGTGTLAGTCANSSAAPERVYR